MPSYLKFFGEPEVGLTRVVLIIDSSAGLLTHSSNVDSDAIASDDNENVFGDIEGAADKQIFNETSLIQVNPNPSEVVRA